MYNDYQDVITERLFDLKQVKGDTRKIPSGRKRVAYTKMLSGLCYLGIYVVFGSKYNFCAMLEPWFAELSFPRRVLAAQFFGVFERVKYYAIWTLTEVCCSCKSQWH
jgi:lysophospholipid acyltransferase